MPDPATVLAVVQTVATVAKSAQQFSKGGSGSKTLRRQQDLDKQAATVQAFGEFFLSKLNPDDPRTTQYAQRVEFLVSTSASPADEQSEASSEGAQLLFDEYRDHALSTGVLLPFPTDPELVAFILSRVPALTGELSSADVYIRAAHLSDFAAQLAALRPQLPAPVATATTALVPTTQTVTVIPSATPPLTTPLVNPNQSPTIQRASSPYPPGVVYATAPVAAPATAAATPGLTPTSPLGLAVIGSAALVLILALVLTRR